MKYDYFSSLVKNIVIVKCAISLSTKYVTNIRFNISIWFVALSKIVLAFDMGRYVTVKKVKNLINFFFEFDVSLQISYNLNFHVPNRC